MMAQIELIGGKLAYEVGLQPDRKGGVGTVGMFGRCVGRNVARRGERFRFLGSRDLRRHGGRRIRTSMRRDVEQA